MVTRSTRTTKPAAAKTVVEDAKIINDAEHTEAAHEAFENEGNFAFERFERFRAAAEEYASSVNMPSGRRVVVSWILGLLAAGGTGYLIGSLVVPLLNALFIAIAVTTTSMFLAWIIYSLGVLAMLYGAWKAGGYVGSKVFAYVVEDKYTEHFGVAKSWVKGLFTSSKPVGAC